MSTEMPSKPIEGQVAFHARHRGTSKAIEAMKDGTPGDTITLAEMEKVTSERCESGTRGRSHVDSAKRHVLRTYGVYWQWSREEQGWVCCDSSQKIDAVQQFEKTITKKAKRNLLILSTVDDTELDAGAKRQKQLSEIMNSMTISLSSKKLRKQLTEEDRRLIEPDYDQLKKLVSPDQ